MINLRPFIIEDYMHLYQLFNITTDELKRLPVVSKPFIGYILENIKLQRESPITEKEVETIYKWAEYLGLMFPFESKKQVFYFVPSLAINAMGNEAKYYWDSENESYYYDANTTVLYAFLKIPANDLFFHQLLAVMIREAMSRKTETLYINSGCHEAIIPLHYSEEEEQNNFAVMTLYHPLQNVIEFRARFVTRKYLSYILCAFTLCAVNALTIESEIFSWPKNFTDHLSLSFADNILAN